MRDALLEARFWLRLLASPSGLCGITQYGGNAGVFEPTIGLIADTDAPNASNFNLSPQALADRTAWLKQRAANAGQNWRKDFSCNAFAPAGTFNLGNCAWDPLTSRWLVGVNADQIAQDAAYAFVGYGLDDDLAESWLPIGSGAILASSGPVVRSLSQDPSIVGQYWAGLYLQTSPTSCALYKCATIASAWSAAVRTWGGGATTAWDIKLAVFNGYLIAAVMGGTVASTYLSSTPNGSTWSDFNPTTPGGAAGALWDLVAGPSQVIAAILNDSLNANQLWVSTNGTSWTGVSLPSFGTHDQVAGVAWDATRSLWVCAVNTTNTLVVYFLTSPDGINWTKIATPPVTSPLQIADIAVLQGNYLCTLADAGTSPFASGSIVSVDGGASWYFDQATFATNLASSDYKYQRSQLVQGSTGLLAHNASRARFSSLAGLPPVAL